MALFVSIKVTEIDVLTLFGYVIIIDYRYINIDDRKVYCMKNKAKQIFAVLLVAILMIGIMPFTNLTVVTSAATYSGTCGDNVKWSFDTVGNKLTISGTGDMYNYNYSNQPWSAYKDTIKKVEVKFGVTRIGSCAFSGCKELVGADLCDGILSIGYGAFDGCKKLSKLIIPSSVQSLEAHSLSGCIIYNTELYNNIKNKSSNSSIIMDNCLLECYGNVPSYVIDDSVRVIADFAFAFYNSNMTSISIPKSVKHIGRFAFYLCDNMTSVTIPETVESIGEFAFGYTNSATRGNMGFEYYKMPGFMVYCYKNTAGHRYAIENGFKYELLDHSHSYSMKIKTEPTCYSEGVKVFSCSCGNSYTETIPMKDHVWGNWVTITQPSGNKNTSRRICSGCGAKEIKDSTSGIGIVYNSEFDSNVNLNITNVYEGNAFGNLEIVFGKENIKLYDITTILNGVKVQPSGKVKVRIPVPTGFDTDKVRVMYYNPEVFSITEIPATIVNGYVEFETDHFSYYAVVEEHGKVKSVSVDDISLNYKDSATINPNINVDADVGYTVEYISSNTDIVTVDGNGKVIATGTGDATVTVTVTDEYGNVVTDNCNISVEYTWWQWIIIIVLFGWIWY